MKPGPVAVAELMVTGAEPVDVKVMGKVAGTFNNTLPNARLVWLTVNTGKTAFNCTVKVAVVVPTVAVSVAASAEGTAETVAVNPAVVAPAGTVTTAGTATAMLLLERITSSSALAGSVRVTVQESIPAPVKDALLQDSVLNVAAATPVPLIGTVTGSLVEPLVVTVNCPVAAPVAVGSNWIFTVALWPELRVTGKAEPDMVNPVPLTVTALTVMGARPVDVNVTGTKAGEFTVTLPNATLAVLMVSESTSTPFVLKLAQPERTTGTAHDNTMSSATRQRPGRLMCPQMRVRRRLGRERPLPGNGLHAANVVLNGRGTGDLLALVSLDSFISFVIQVLRLRY
jgi:hypothetical protein